MDTNKLSQLIKSELSYNPENKAAFLKEAKKTLKLLAKEMGVSAKISVNQGGIACSGEVYLKAGGLFLVVSQFFGGKQVLYRNESEGKAGGHNQYCSVNDLSNQSVQQRMIAMI